MNPKNIFLNNIGIKLLALVLAVISWFYIIGEIKKEMFIQQISEKKVVEPKETTPNGNIVTKVVPVYPKIKGKPQDGFKVVEEGVSVKPGTVTLKGNVDILDKINFVSTEVINVSGNNKILVKKVSIDGLSKEIEVNPQKDIEVTIPIEKIKR